MILNSQLKLGILVSSDEIPAWQYALLGDLLNLNSLEVDTLIFDESPSDRLESRRTWPLMYLLFKRVDGKLPRDIPDACALKSIERLFQHKKKLSIQEYLASTEGVSRASAAGTDESYNLDIVLALSESKHIQPLADACRLGVLNFRHDRYGVISADGLFVGLWEVLRRAPHVKSQLMFHKNGKPSSEVCMQSYSGIFHSSQDRTRNEHLWKIASLPARLLRYSSIDSSAQDIRFSNALYRESKLDDQDAAPSFTNLGLFLPLVKYGFWRAMQKWRRGRYMERWILMFSRQSGAFALSDYQKLMPPPGRFWADPHALFKDGRHFIFMEDASIESGRGHISVIELDGQFRPSPPKAIIERPYHLSYPFLLEWQDDLYLIPESAENRTIDAFRCAKFPFEWEYDQTLMRDVAAYDATIFEYGGRWWMFVNIQEREGTSSWDELHLFFADTPLGSEWQPHVLNPIVSDVRYARPAGPLFEQKGRIYRPAQDSSYRYGFRLNIMEIQEMTPSTYRESLRESLSPPDGSAIRAMHSYTRAGSLTVIDAIYRQSRSQYEK